MRKTPASEPNPPREIAPGAPNAASGEGWGKAVHKRVPSGVKLVLQPDSDCILRFVGQKDISDQVADADGPVIYLTFFDGKRFVSMPVGYATKDVSFEAGKWYYIHHQGNVELPGRNPLKDLDIFEIGTDGETVECPERVADARTVELKAATIAVINYTRLNYPLR